jgi:exodeoxyribonuclease VII small subunit
MSKRSSQQSAPKSFEEALQELEQILSDIENGEVGLEESLVKYERGNFLIQHCRGVLSAAEKQIEALADGEENPNDENLKSETMTKPE